jgi:ubiquilin
MTITLHIRRSTGATFDVLVDLHETVRVIKERIATLHDDLPADCQRLIYKGHILDNSKDLVSYEIPPEATLHLVKGKPDGTGPTTTGTTATTVATRNTGCTSATLTEPIRPVPTTYSTMNSTANSTSIAPLPDFNTLQRDLQQNPERITEMMNSPVMQSIMDSPDDVLRSIMNMNPQMRELMEQNPQLREVLNDPQLMRQSLQMMRDPQAMQTAMRNQELAMSQIENMPGKSNIALSHVAYSVAIPRIQMLTNKMSCLVSHRRICST